MPSFTVAADTISFPVITDFYASYDPFAPTRNDKSQHRLAGSTDSTRPTTNCPGWNTFVASFVKLSAASRSATYALKS